MTDLKALREQLATEIAGNVAACFVMADGIPANLPQDIDAALKKYALACLGEPSSEKMNSVGELEALIDNNESHDSLNNPSQVWWVMAAMRAKELE